MQLVAYGAQDIYLTGNPQITFFKVVYRRHTNFSMESIEQTFNGTADFGKKVTATISRNGDLIHRVYLQVELPSVSAKSDASFRWVNWVGHALIKNVEVEIGGQRIDKHYGDWLHIWNELTQESGKQEGYANMVGNVDRLFRPVGGGDDAVGTAGVSGEAGNVGTYGGNSLADGTMPAATLFIPLQFWFCRNPGLALPLIALQYHEVKINIEFRNAAECCGTEDGKMPSIKLNSASLYVDYIYLDTDERRRFAQVSHEYLIEQLQFTGEESVSQTNAKIKLNFNHPCKELIWVVQKDAFTSTQTHTTAGCTIAGRQWFNYSDRVDKTPFDKTNPYVMRNVNDNVINTSPESQINDIDDLTFGLTGGATKAATGQGGNAAGGGSGGLLGSYNPLYDAGGNPVDKAKLQLNGHDRFSERSGRYFNLVQPYQHHTNVPSVGINVYSFGLKPEEHQPSGTCNMSRIDNATLNLTLTKAATEQVLNGSTEVEAAGSCKVRVYATNYNVLRIMSGMGGLAYSN